MVKCALWGVMLNFDVFDELSPSGESIAVPGAIFDRAAMWATIFMQGHEVRLKIFDSIERLLGRTSMNIASAGLDIVHEMGMPNFNVMPSCKPFPVLASRDIAPMGLQMKLEMPVEVGVGLECDSRFSRSTARPLARTWNNELAFNVIAMVMQVLNKLLCGQERLLFARWPFTTHWCYFRSLSESSNWDHDGPRIF
ncbi:hypothetical protein VE00_10812 [Pseudogymnoascus sp. WSF 3629]|nr:hypothetical protein VE00_10812 [Pseudogymnoascus sp. WSF 3629]